MKKISVLLFVVLLFSGHNLKSQDLSEAEFFLLTCGPGTETYSVYGHSALRILLPDKNSDFVYNWGVFDFDTPNFAWKFAKGRLEYMLGVYPYKSFLEEYKSENRWVISQKINLEEEEKHQLFVLISENLKPENIKYRYDFFFDDCSTRIRDLLEKAVGNKLLYPTEEAKKKLPTFRQLTGEHQKGFPWLNFGIDLLMGSPCDKKAAFRDRMFLPLYLQTGLSALEVRQGDKMIPLLTNPEVKISSGQPALKENPLGSPIFIFSLTLIVFILLSAVFKKTGHNRIMDLLVFALFALLSVLMIFSNFFTDHQQMKWNLNIIWLNPFIIICLACLILNKGGKIWFRLTFWFALVFLILMALLPQHINNACLPLITLLILRSSIRSGFSWNLFKMEDLT
jgi:hypothetical protein